MKRDMKLQISILLRMKQLLNYLYSAILIFSATGCELDNYEGPDASLSGRILIAGTNEQLQTEPGKGNMKIRLKEISWEGVEQEAIQWQELNMKMDGTYRNDKLFSGAYIIFPYEGPFYPILEADWETIEIKGNTVKDFYVTPYLKAEWVELPHVVEKPVPNSNPVVMGKYIEAKAKFTRIAPPAGYPSPIPELNGGSNGNGFCRMFVSPSHYVGQNSLLQVTSDNIPINNSQEGQAIEFSMIDTEPLKYTNTSYYVRCGFSATGTTKRYNYTEAFELFVP